MSGPKTSIYTLTPEQRRIMEEQRKIEQRKAVAAENIQRNAKRLMQIRNMFVHDKQVAAELNSRSANDDGFMQKMNELEMLITPIDSFVAKTDRKDVSALERTSERVSECAAKAEEIARELSAVAVQNEIRLQAILDAAIDEGFTASFADLETAPRSSADETKGRMREQLLQMGRNFQLPAEMMEEIRDTVSKIGEIEDEDFLKNYSALTVLPLMKRCERFLAEYAECHEEFEKRYSEYIAICELYDFTARKYPCTAASVEALQMEIQRIKEAAAEEDEQAYISECLDEVMEEMGYTVLGHREVTKKSGRTFRNELYSYGDGMAVNVTYTSDGKIAMELGGIDDADRLPDEQETALLCDSMETFCDEFKEMERRLLAKGLILADRISLLPPSAEYAQIINTSDYEMKGEASKIKTRKQRRIADKLKMMRIEG